MNNTMMQFFHWYTSADGNLWNEVSQKSAQLCSLGINAVWLPPAYKGKNGALTNGYDAYDIFDLGEFDQKGAIRTKYGTKEEYQAAVKALQTKGIHVYVDIVLNHKAGADEKERITVIKVDPENRNVFISEPFDIDAFTRFTFPGRKGRYSEFTWDYNCFSGIDFAADLEETAIFSILNDYGTGWEEMNDDEKGNYDYLMFNDIDFRNPAVRKELKYWGEWYLREVPFDGVRLDAVKHISPEFYNEWLDHLRTLKPDLFAVGEYWSPHHVERLLGYIERTNNRMALFDAPLQFRFHVASKSGSGFNMASILEGSLLSVKPELAVTLVSNHDTQPLQALEAPVEPWFKPLAYALILLRQSGYPCIFYPDLYGAHYKDKGQDGSECEIEMPVCENLDKLLLARTRYAYGEQHDYFDHPNCIGWTRTGDEHVESSGCAVILSNGEEGFKKMFVGERFAGSVFIDFLGKFEGEIIIDNEGCAEFRVCPASVSVWVQKK